MPNPSALARPLLTPLRFVLALALILAGWVIGKFFVNSANLGRVDSAIASMRELVSNENAFAHDHPKQGYSCRLEDVIANTAIKDGKRAGFAFEISNCTASGSGPNTTYRVTARPLRSQLPAYCADQSGILKVDYGGSVATCLNNGERF